ncbi:hypothetical protein [Rhodococcus sp. NPDC057529]|uniref:hypothetical protein n=1 Tax=Rhodococcus sp. NPDC057529 TaxID=3346158 RepID=UPI003670D339
MYVDLGTITQSVGSSPNPVVPRRYRYDWALFVDWCTACDHRALPAQPSALAQFLAEHPAADGTQRRRVTGINIVHTQAGLPAPGRAETIRQVLNTARAERIGRLSAVAVALIARIPVTGWPAGLFGRRDALILALVAAGLGFEQIARLSRGDITVESEALVINTGDAWIRVPSSVTDATTPVAAYQNWIEVVGFLDRYPSTKLLARQLGKEADLSGFAECVRHDDRPLLMPIDRWGHTPYVPTPLTAQSVATIVRAHLTGQAPAHTPPPVRPRHTPARPDPTPRLDAESIELDQDYYDRGIHSRRTAHDTLKDVTDILDDIEDEADKLLADLLLLLDDSTAD